MSSMIKFLKIAIIYVVFSVIVLDIYLAFLKPFIIESLGSTSADVIQDETSARTQPARGLRLSCFADESRLQSPACAQYYGRKVNGQSELFTKKLRQYIVGFTYSLWDRLFLFFEEIEIIALAMAQASTFLWQSNSQQKYKNQFSAITTLPEYHLFNTKEQKIAEESKKQFALSASIQKNILQKNVKIHSASQEDTIINITSLNMARQIFITIDLRREANNTLKIAREFIRLGNLAKARKLLEHARQLDPQNANAMAAYGEVFEQDKPPDYVQAEHYYGKALLADPNNEGVQASRRRTLPLVEQIDQSRFNRIDRKVFQYYHIPEGHPGLRKLKKEHYYRYVYHTNAIEGNTLSLAQTRAILETRLAVGGKSVLEHNEVLGLDHALKYLNSSLLRKQGPFGLQDILEIHRRVLGFVDLQEAGRLRNTQVFIADFQPPPANLVPDLMSEFIAWLNADDTQELHPIELAALAHWKLVYIHPFYDGNGRTARLLMNLILMRAGYPPAIVRVEDRALYYQLIREANEGDVRPFMRFIAHCTEATIDEFILTAKNVINFEGSLSQQPIDGLAKPRVINL